MVRSILSLYAHQDVPAEEWEFAANAYGKPAVIGPAGRAAPSVHFNLSHTRGMIVLAVTGQTDIGVDVELRTGTSKTVDIAESFFSPREVEELRALTGDQERDRFYDLWTLKEAYIKARGMGLSLPLDGFSFQFPSTDGIEIAFGPKVVDEAANWNFWLLSAGADHRVAVAIKADSPEARFRLCVREFRPLSSYALVDWPCLRSSDSARQ